MGLLVLRLDMPCSVYIIENQQLILAKKLDPSNVNQLLDDVGDYPISEVGVYLKPDSRPELSGVCIDVVISETGRYEFFISDSDYDFIKAVALKFGASMIRYFSAFRYYQSLTPDGVVIDYYTDHNYIVANMIDGLYRNITICSPERLQKTVSTCNSRHILYASQKAIPELLNINNIPVEFQETLAFLQFVMFGKACCEINVDSGEMFVYGDQESIPRYYTLSDEERGDVIDSIRKRIGPTVIKEKRKFSFNDIGVTLIYLAAAIALSLSLFTVLKISDDFTALETKTFEQATLAQKLEVEKKYLQDSIDNFGKDGITARLLTLDEVLNNGSIMSVRFNISGLEVTLFVTDEAMRDRAVVELEKYYTVEAVVYEKDVKDQVSGHTFNQYNIVLKYPN